MRTSGLQFTWVQNGQVQGSRVDDVASCRRRERCSLRGAATLAWSALPASVPVDTAGGFSNCSVWGEARNPGLRLAMKLAGVGVLLAALLLYIAAFSVAADDAKKKPYDLLVLQL